MSKKQGSGREGRRLALVMAVAAAFSGVASGQSTTGSIFGTVAAGKGDSVMITGNNGVSREAKPDATGHYAFNALPLGTYTVTLERQGKTVSSHGDVVLRVNGGSQVDFADQQAATSLSAIKVRASSPAIDVSTVDSRTVVTAQQLANLPLGRNAEDIAMLAPGTVSSGSNFTSRIGAGSGNLVSFGGSSAAENAYYINGFNSTDPYKGLGGLQLPYGSIEQQEVLTGGYSAQYGRSDGGVINQVGKSGSNDWHFGGQVLWEPSGLASSPGNIYYANNRYKGQLYDYRADDKSWTSTYSVYAGGPLIKDKLYIFASAEVARQEGTTTSNSNVSNPYQTSYRNQMPRWYTKVNWNITDNNILELTGLSSKESSSGSNSYFDYATKDKYGHESYSDSTKTGGDAYIGKFTSYLTDRLTLSVMYGKMHLHDYDQPHDYDSSLPYLNNIADENLALTGGSAIGNSQTTSSISSPKQGSKATNFRFDLEYQLGDHHKLKFGLDNQVVSTIDQGGNSATWTYAHNDNAEQAIDASSGIGAPGGQGYYVMKESETGASSVKTKERAQYLEDNWQVTDRLLINLGLRNDAFANYNNSNVKFTNQKHNWAPRLGFSWDPFGDASLKVYGNAGRYYLAINNNTAYDGATGYAWNRSYYNYTGIDANGMPTGLSLIGSNVVNGHTGQAPDPRTVASSNLGAEYQDEFILGATKQLNENWVAGAKATYRVLRQISDDVCDSANLLIGKAEKMYGLSAGQITSNSGSCYIFNPGKTNNFYVNTTSGYVSVPMSDADWGFSKGPVRKYYSMELFLEHPQGNGRWGGRLTYVFSRSYGNSEGLLRSSSGDTSVGVTSDWDNAYVMEYSNGVLGSDRKHQIKANGVYQISPEWLVSGVLNIASGGPKSCTGFYGVDQTQPDSYGSKYHWCDGSPSTPGSLGRMPWTHRIDLNLAYRPAFAKHRLAFNLSVFNVFNEQRPILRYEQYNSTSTPDKLNDTYGMTKITEAPRYVRFGITYDY